MLYHLTNYCSWGCPHCFLDATTEGKHALRDTTKKFIEFGIRMETMKIMVGGGEPTQHPDFFNHMKEILEGFKGRAVVGLATNGQFLLNDKGFVDSLADLQKYYPTFCIQVSALEGIYPKQKEIVAAFNEHRHNFLYNMVLVEKITALDIIGRAKGKDWSHLGELYKKKAPQCFNVFSLSRNTMNLTQLCIMHEQLVFNSFCKPTVSSNGNVYPGETNLCVKIGNLYEDNDTTIFGNMLHNKPCGSCGYDVDSFFEERMKG